MQGVFIKQIIADLKHLEEVVKDNPGRTFIRVKTDSGIQALKINTKAQNEKEQKNLATAELLGLAPSPKHVIVLEDLIAGGYEYTEVEKLSVQICYIRPKTKKALSACVMEHPSKVYIEGISIFGNEYDGLLSDAPFSDFHVVGPDPEMDRRWFGMISWSKKKKTWIVK